MLQRKVGRFLDILRDGVTIEGDHQRDGVGVDQLNAVFIINVLFPERRQMHLSRVEVVTPFIGIVSGNTVAGNGARHAEHGVALGIEA